LHFEDLPAKIIYNSSKEALEEFDAMEDLTED
jgi:hypothetical protein